MSEHTQSKDENGLIQLLIEQGLNDGLKSVAQWLINNAMIAERSQHLNASPHERTDQRNGYANGFKPRTFISSLGELQLQNPQVRDSDQPFQSSLLEKGSRSDRALNLAIAEMYVQGVSTRKVSKIVEELCGASISSTTVSNLAAQLDAEFESWRSRPLPEIRYLIVDATYYKVRLDGVVRDCATLIAIGVERETGKRQILGVSCALSEAEVHWRTFLNSLRERGIGIPDMVTSDAHEGLKAALKASFSATPWQRCQFHLQQNAQSYVPSQNLKAPVAADIRKIFNASNLPEAQQKLQDFLSKYEKKAPKLTQWAEMALPEGFTVFQLPEKHQKRLRTSNMCETLNGDIKRRTKVAGLFPNEDSLLRLVTAVLVEKSETWEIGKKYLDFSQN